ncbi:MAG: hypothetical protein WCX31_04615 [Salinivirgaceae bacterium]|jgi:hypothetical protein
MAVVNITGLQREAKNYQKDFRVLPYAILIDVLKILGISLLEVNYKDTIVVEQRKGGVAKPYVAGTLDYITEIAKLSESDLITVKAYAALKDDIESYRAKNVLFDASANKVNNQDKKHPLERDIIAKKVITVAEDIIDALFPSNRNTADKTPMGMVDGFDTIISDAITATDISLAKGNLVNSGALDAPVDGADTTAYDNLITWLRKADEKAKDKPLILRIPPVQLLNVQDALQNKLAVKAVEFEDVLKHIQFRSGLSKLSIASHYCLGTGERMHLTTPGNFDLGMNTFGDIDFVQVRNIFEDPNLVQFWMQWHIGMRITNLHKREFMVNEGVPVANSLSGDYTA